MELKELAVQADGRIRETIYPFCKKIIQNYGYDLITIALMLMATGMLLSAVFGAKFNGILGIVILAIGVYRSMDARKAFQRVMDDPNEIEMLRKKQAKRPDSVMSRMGLSVGSLAGYFIVGVLMGFPGVFIMTAMGVGFGSYLYLVNSGDMYLDIITEIAAEQSEE